MAAAIPEGIQEHVVIQVAAAGVAGSREGVDDGSRGSRGWYLGRGRGGIRRGGRGVMLWYCKLRKNILKMKEHVGMESLKSNQTR